MERIIDSKKHFENLITMEKVFLAFFFGIGKNLMLSDNQKRLLKKEHWIY